MGDAALEAMYYRGYNRDGCRIPVRLRYKSLARLEYLGLFRHAF